MPPISNKLGPIPICPSDKKVKSFFSKLGTVIEINNEKSSKNFWVTSSMMAPFYELLKVLSDWLVKRGVKRNEAQKYISSLFIALSIESDKKTLPKIEYIASGAFLTFSASVLDASKFFSLFMSLKKVT